MRLLQNLFVEGGPVLVAITFLSVMAWTLVCHCWLRSAWLQRQIDRLPGQSGLDLSMLAWHTSGLEQALRVVAVMASVLPMLGLLGTVWGMLVTFEVIQQYGTGQPRLLARGIGQALLTTQAGLWAALPVLGLQHILLSRVRCLRRDLNRSGIPRPLRGDQAFETSSNAVTLAIVPMDKQACLSPYVPTQL